MALEQTWRWFGPNDPIKLEEIKQTGVSGIVTALHHIPVGEVWSIDEIQKRKSLIENHNLKWSVVESLPIHEDIKKRESNFSKYIENYKTSLINLSKCGIDTVCYNFMPVLDWSRTNLRVIYSDGSITTKFDKHVFAAFDLFILKRKNAEKDYSQSEFKKAEDFFLSLNEKDKQELIDTILLGLPGSLQKYSLEEFKSAIESYENIDKNILRNNLIEFLKEVIPVAEEHGIYLVIHPDDPPFQLLGLPRVAGTIDDFNKIFNSVDSENNGLTLCTGSLGSFYKNDLIEITKNFIHKINFIHLRNVTRNSDYNFMEVDHLEGDVDIYTIMKLLLLEQKDRINKNKKNVRLPFRPDHGRLMLPDMNREGIYPGYSLFGRMRAISELRGMELAIRRELNLE
ncbi:MAG: mannonate dehydratase [Melioribacteraceae bacterium]|nr:mannonate dehydratase [Melioribacteraceae bacterium]